MHQPIRKCPASAEIAQPAVSRRRDSNPQPSDYKSDALPIAPRRLARWLIVVGSVGLGRRSRPLPSAR